jgi:hypothetical protein
VLQAVLNDEWASTDLEFSLRSVTVSRNYCLAMLVIFAFCKVVKYLSQLPTEFSLCTTPLITNPAPTPFPPTLHQSPPLLPLQLHARHSVSLCG